MLKYEDLCAACLRKYSDSVRRHSVNLLVFATAEPTQSSLDERLLCHTEIRSFVSLEVCLAILRQVKGADGTNAGVASQYSCVA